MTQDLIDQFNDAEDFSKLPEDQSLKCYMYCQFRQMDMMDPDIPDMRFDVMAQNVEILQKWEQEIFLKMGRKCLRVRPKKKEVCEVAYAFNVCLKRGDIDVSLKHNFSKVR